MSQQIRYQLWIAAAASVIFFTHLGAAGLWDMDEALYASCAREMQQRGDLIVPWFNGRMFPEKPPLMFWTMIAGFELFGVNELGARFFSAVLGVGTALLAFHLGRLLFGVRVGLWTGLITASTIVFTISARAATVDCELTFLTTAAMLLFVLAKMPGGGAKPQAANSPSPNLHIPKSPKLSRPLRRPYAALMYACVGLAALAKGPVGMVLPPAALGLYLLFEGGWRKIFRSAWEMRPLTGVVVMAAVALPWYVMVGRETNGEWLRQFFFEFNLRPFKQPILGHGDAGSLQHIWAAIVSLLYYFYHIPAILVGFFPWSVFLGPTLVYTVRCLRRNECQNGDFHHYLAPGEYTGGNARAAKNADSPPCIHGGLNGTPYYGCVFAACWFGAWLVFWSVCKTKLPHYLLPAYPALALLTARWIDAIKGSGVFNEPPAPKIKTPDPFIRCLIRCAWISTIVAGLGIVIAVPIVAAHYLPGEAAIGLVGLIPVVGGAWCRRESARGRNQQAFGVFAVMSALFLTATFGFAALRVDRHQNARPMIAAIRADCVGQVGNLSHNQVDNLSRGSLPPIATYRFFRESTVYYSGGPVTRCEGERRAALKQLADFLAQPCRSYIIATDRQEREILKAFPGRLKVIFRQPRFLAPGEMVVLRCDGAGGGSTKPDN